MIFNPTRILSCQSCRAVPCRSRGTKIQVGYGWGPADSNAYNFKTMHVMFRVPLRFLVAHDTIGSMSSVFYYLPLFSLPRCVVDRPDAVC